jgi:hypothetical protein
MLVGSSGGGFLSVRGLGGSLCAREPNAQKSATMVRKNDFMAWEERSRIRTCPMHMKIDFFEFGG